MISETYSNISTYIKQMEFYFFGGISTRGFVLQFFKTRSEDLEKQARGASLPIDDPEGKIDPDAWDDLFMELFWACEDVDIGEEGSPDDSKPEVVMHTLSDQQFRAKIQRLQSRFEGFKNHKFEDDG